MEANWTRAQPTPPPSRSSQDQPKEKKNQKLWLRDEMTKWIQEKPPQILTKKLNASPWEEKTRLLAAANQPPAWQLLPERGGENSRRPGMRQDWILTAARERFVRDFYFIFFLSFFLSSKQSCSSGDVVGGLETFPRIFFLPLTSNLFSWWSLSRCCLLLLWMCWCVVFLALFVFFSSLLLLLLLLWLGRKGREGNGIFRWLD